MRHQADSIRRVRQASIRLTSIAAASVLSALALQPGANAAVVYLDPCFACALTSAPPAGDEWVVQGNFVYTSGDLSSRGALTNSASYFSNGYTLSVFAPLTNNKNFINSGNLQALGAAINNSGTFLNTGSMVATTQVNNLAGRFVNNGNFESYAIITNKAVFSNAGTLTMKTGGTLSNELGATVDNTGNMSYFLSSFTNKGTFRNHDGGQIQTSGIFNTGTLINDTGSTINSSNAFVNASGSKLVNHGTIISGDSSFNMAAGSTYDFTNGKLVISNSLGRMYLNRDFTFGEAKAGTVEVGYGGSLSNYANMQIAKGYNQLIAGRITNYETGAITINANATLRTGDVVTNKGKFTNLGTFKLGEVLTGNAIANSGTVELTGSFVNAAITGQGKLLVNEGNSLINAGTTFSTAAFNGGNTILRSTLTATGVTVGAQGTVQHQGNAVVSTTSGLTVNGNYTFNGEGGTVKGPVTNNGTVTVAADSKAVFEGKVNSQGQFIAEGNTKTQIQGDFVVGANGVIKAANDTFTVTGSFLDGRTSPLTSNTDTASLIVQGASLHKLALSGKDVGAIGDGFHNNGGWGSLLLGADGQFALSDGNAVAGAALYVGQFSLTGGLGQLASINSPFNIYYNIHATGNEYLDGKTYALGSGGGKLIGVNVAESLSKAAAAPMPINPTAVPEPSAWALALGGVLVTLWRRKARPVAHQA